MQRHLITKLKTNPQPFSGYVFKSHTSLSLGGGVAAQGYPPHRSGMSRRGGEYRGYAESPNALSLAAIGWGLQAERSRLGRPPLLRLTASRPGWIITINQSIIKK